MVSLGGQLEITQACIDATSIDLAVTASNVITGIVPRRSACWVRHFCSAIRKTPARHSTVRSVWS